MTAQTETPAEAAIGEIFEDLKTGLVVPYIGAGVLALAGEDCPLPATPEQLVAKLTSSVSVPHKIRWNLTAAAQFIENFKHRKTVTKGMTASFEPDVPLTPLHEWLGLLPSLPMVVHAWYDNLVQKALAHDGAGSLRIVQGVSQAEHFGEWTHAFDASGAPVTEDRPARTLLYEPLGSIAPAANFLVSDSDFVEVLTEIDIQTPIPQAVQDIRKGRHFLFLGCRFNTQMDRLFARQIMKRSSDRHWAVLPEDPTKNEARFLREQNIERIEMPLGTFVETISQTEGQKP